MRTRLSLGLVLALVLGGLALASVPAAAQTPVVIIVPSPSPLLVARMIGTAEIPGPGDPDGLGFARLVVSPDQRQVCYTLQVVNVATPTAAHIK